VGKSTWYCPLLKGLRIGLVTLPIKGPSWLWSYGSWIYNYLCNICLSPLKLWVRTHNNQVIQFGHATALAIYCRDVAILAIYCRDVAILAIYCKDVAILAIYCRDVAILAIYCRDAAILAIKWLRADTDIGGSRGIKGC
jgi:hypothetical protein